MLNENIRDRCCWKQCRQESTIVFYGAGLCDEHYDTACSVFKNTAEYLISRVVPEAADLIRDQHTRNQEATEAHHGPTESEHADQT